VENRTEEKRGYENRRFSFLFLIRKLLVIGPLVAPKPLKNPKIPQFLEPG
jgi:hypothetical protein